MLLRMRLALAVLLVGCGGGPVAPSDAGMDAQALSGAIGAACSLDTDCAGTNAVCLRTTTSFTWPNWPGGYCSMMGCTFGAACDSRSTCAPLPGMGPYCFVNGTSNDDCRGADGYTCQMHPFSTGQYCLPAPPPDAG